jgi:hypothetical protein
MAQVVKYLLSKHADLSSSTSITKSIISQITLIIEPLSPNLYLSKKLMKSCFQSMHNIEIFFKFYQFYYLGNIKKENGFQSQHRIKDKGKGKNIS